MRQFCLTSIMVFLVTFCTFPMAHAQPPALLSEGFADITTLPDAGWVQSNQSSPLGTTDWFQGNPVIFPAQTGATYSYIGANFDNTDGTGTISNWLVTPVLDFAATSQVTFWTRTGTVPLFADRLEVRLSTNGSSSNTGTSATDVGDFTTLLLTINPDLTLTGYPDVWTQYVLDSLPATGTGRIAFRYFVTDGGDLGTNSDYIGIDTFEVVGKQYTITATAGANGAISPSGTVSVDHGGNQVFTISPDPGYHVADVLVDGVSVGAVTSYTFTSITANHAIEASFSDTYTITATAGVHGTISPSGSVSVSPGGDQVFTITPDPGYHVADVLVDGASAGEVTSYTFTNVTANHTISASFHGFPWPMFMPAITVNGAP